MKEQLKTLRQKLQENPASFTTAEKAFLRCILTRDDELGNIRFITKEFVNLLDNKDISPWSLVKWTSKLIHPDSYTAWALAEHRENNGQKVIETVLFWDQATATLVALSGHKVTVGELSGSADEILASVISAHCA